MITVIDELIAAKALIATKATWTKKVFSRDAKGVGRPALSTEAVCWCAIGAVEKVKKDNHYAAELYAPVTPGDVIAGWRKSPTWYLGAANSLLFINKNVAKTNDTLGFDAVHAVYDLAIALAEEDAKVDATKVIRDGLDLVFKFDNEPSFHGDGV